MAAVKAWAALGLLVLALRGFFPGR